jgi:signal peptidase I
MVFWPVRYDGVGMNPSIGQGDRIFISRIAPFFGFLSTGDIVVYTFEGENGKKVDALMRVIGAPGDRISVIEGIVYLNGLRLNEPYLQPGMLTFPDIEPVVLQNSQYFLLIDDRKMGGDSRDFGAVHRSDISAKALVRFMRAR